MALRFSAKLKIFNNLVTRHRYIHVSAVTQKLTQFILSDIGEGIREVTVREWFVKVSEEVKQFDDICLVESDKASVNITSRFDGVIKKLYYQVGDIALVGKPLLDIDTPDNPDALQKLDEFSKDSDSTIKSDEGVSARKELLSAFERYENEPHQKKLATPAVRRIAMEHKISLKDVLGTGKAGRVMKEDILNYVKRLTGLKDDKLGGQTVLPITGIKKVMLKSMTESKKIPTFGYYDEVNMTKLVTFREEMKDLAKKKGLVLSYMPFFIKATSKCLEKFPEINSSLDETLENIIIKTSHNIGFAVDSQQGLIVPNIKDVQHLPIFQINEKLNVLLENGKKGKFMPSDLTNGTFTISNIGAIGGTYAVPLINPPEVCILAIGKIRVMPLFNDKNEIIKAHICSISWTADHRIIDGATMARFSNLWKEYIENPSYLLMDQ